MPTYRKVWFNPLFFILNEVIKDENIRTILVYGGKSSSKTVSITQVLSLKCYSENSNVIAYRKESSIIPTTLKKTFNLAINSTKLNNAFITQDRRYVCNNKIGTSEIVLKGIDSEEKAKGIESYKYLYLDELNQFEYAEYEQFEMSLRGIKGQKIFASWNPVDETSWVKTNVVDAYEWTDSEYTLPNPESFVKRSKDGKAVLIKTNYKDNYWIVGSPCGTYGYRDENLISVYESLKKRNYASYRVNVEGEWGRTISGGEFWNEFKEERDIVQAEYVNGRSSLYDPQLPIYLTYDINVRPYVTCLVWQIKKGGIAQQIDEVCIENVKANVQEFIKRYPPTIVKGLYITGDRSAIADDAKLERGKNFYTIIGNLLKEYKPSIRIPRMNPSVKESKDFINEAYAGNIEGLTIQITSICKKSIYDYKYCLESPDGTVHKSKIKDPITGISYEEFGHCSDAKRYFIMNFFASLFADWKSGGKSFSIQIGEKRANYRY